MSYLEVKNLSVRFPISNGFFRRAREFFTAVDRVSFSLQKGEALALIGESGSGKTTIANTILGLLDPAEGDIILNGESVQNYRFKGKVQAVFQNPYSSLNPRMNIFRIVSEPYRHLHPEISEERVIEKSVATLEKVGINDCSALFRYPHEFSGGQRQRISIARALISDPEIIILDEPVSSLDVSIRAQILNLLSELKKIENLSYLYISHDLATVRFLCEKLLIIEKGKMVEYGETGAVFDDPQSAYTRKLLKSAREILVDGSLIQDGHKKIREIQYPLSFQYKGGEHVVYGRKM